MTAALRSIALRTAEARELRETGRVEVVRSVSNATSRGNYRASELDLAGDVWIDPGPSPAGNPGPYLKARPLAKAERDDGVVDRLYPRWFRGDRLRVREGWRSEGAYPDNGQVSFTWRAGGRGYAEMASWARYLRPDPPWLWRSAATMPPEAVRTIVEVEAVRVEREGAAWRWRVGLRVSTNDEATTERGGPR